jgi:catechol 2,3-dioxygenase-like lactoylglutathione lyase family enzyme
MLDHVSITVTDIGAAEKFYDAVMSALGVPKVRKSELRLGYGERCDGDHPDRNYLSIKIGDQPDDAPLRGIGASKRLAGRQWKLFGKLGWRTGGRTTVPQGIRDIYHASYYAAFLIDPSGNRMEAVCHLRAG